MEPPSSDSEPLRREDTEQVRAAHGFLVAADERRDFERREKSVRQFAERRPWQLLARNRAISPFCGLDRGMALH